MNVTVSVPGQLAAQEGLSLKAYIERLLEGEAQRQDQPKWTRFGPGPLTSQEAGQDIRELRKGIILGVIKINDLIREGQR